MQIMFGRILAGEIKQPESFSIKAIKALDELDCIVAKLFQKLCSCSITTPIPIWKDTRVCSLGSNASANSLQKFGLGFYDLNILNEYDLIISDYNSYQEYVCVLSKGSKLNYFVRNGENFYATFRKNKCC